jgi:putative ABC transport system permease protein
MLRNYFITAYRNLLRNKIFSVINVFGLVIAMAVCMMIAEYVVFEKSFDKFHTHYKNLYRMVNVRHYLTHVDESAGCVVALGPTLKETFPEVKNFTRCYKSERSFTVNNNPVKFRSVFSVDSTFLDLFSFDILAGASKGILKKPNTAVLTQSSARVLFGDVDPVGKIILQGTIPYTVEAVAADVPENSHLKFDLLISFTTDLADPNYCVTCNNRNTYILLDENTDAKVFEAKMDKVVGILHPQAT